MPLRIAATIKAVCWRLLVSLAFLVGRSLSAGNSSARAHYPPLPPTLGSPPVFGPGFAVVGLPLPTFTPVFAGLGIVSGFFFFPEQLPVRHVQQVGWYFWYHVRYYYVGLVSSSTRWFKLFVVVV